jgi:hypothetical protein
MYNSRSFLSHSRIVKGLSLLCLCVALVSALMLAPMGFAQAAIPTLAPAPTQVLAPLPKSWVQVVPAHEETIYPNGYCRLTSQGFVGRLENIGNAMAPQKFVTVAFIAPDGEHAVPFCIPIHFTLKVGLNSFNMV